jgi:hypothetical protein
VYLLILNNIADQYETADTYALLISESPAVGAPGYEVWKNRFPELYSFNVDPEKLGDPDCLFTTINFIKNNVVLGSEINYGDTYEKFADKENNVAYGIEDNRFFNDPTHGDYTFKSGMTPIDFDFSKLGIQ